MHTDDKTPIVFVHSEPLPYGAGLLRALLADDPEYLRLGLLPPGGYAMGTPPEIPSRAPGNYKDPAKIAEYLRDAKSKYLSETLPNWRMAEYQRCWDEFKKSRHLAHRCELGTVFLQIQNGRTEELQARTYTDPRNVTIPPDARWVGWDRATMAAIGGQAVRHGCSWGVGLLAAPGRSLALSDDIDLGRVPPGLPRPARAVRELLGLDPLPSDDYRAAEAWIKGDDATYDYHSLNALSDLIGAYAMLAE